MLPEEIRACVGRLEAILHDDCECDGEAYWWHGVFLGTSEPQSLLSIARIQEAGIRRQFDAYIQENPTEWHHIEQLTGIPQAAIRDFLNGEQDLPTSEQLFTFLNSI